MLVAGSDDRLRLWEHPNFGPAKTPQGALLALYDHGGECAGACVRACARPRILFKGSPNDSPHVSTDPIHATRQIEPLALTNFPADVAFHPHGIYFHPCVRVPTFLSPPPPQ